MSKEKTIPVPSNWNAWASTLFREIRPVKSKHCYATEYAGDRLASHGVLKGDMLIIDPKARYVPGTLAIWKTPEGLKADFDPVANGQLEGVCVRVERDNPTVTKRKLKRNRKATNQGGQGP